MHHLLFISFLAGVTKVWYKHGVLLNLWLATFLIPTHSQEEKKETVFYVLRNITVILIFFFFLSKMRMEKINLLSTYQISLTQVISMKSIRIDQKINIKPASKQVQNGFIELSPFCFPLQSLFSLFFEIDLFWNAYFVLLATFHTHEVLIFSYTYQFLILRF